jgi:phosphoglycolate phosphatase
MAPKAVLFDLDGTLLDTSEDIGDSVNRVLARHGYPTHSIDAYRTFIGDGVEMLILRALPSHMRDDDRIHLCMKEYREDYSHNWDKKTKPYDGVPEMLDILVTRGLPMAILSNKPDESARQCAAQLLSDWTFDLIVGASATLPLKPDPAGALLVARTLGISPADFLYVGDTAVDMRTALAAGMFAVGVLWGFRSGELEDNGAQALIERPSDIVNLL